MNKIDAARMDVDELFARDAFISMLTTSNIFAGESLTVIAGRANDAEQAATTAARVFRQTIQPLDSESRVGDLWINPDNGEIRQATSVEFASDEDGVLYLATTETDTYDAQVTENDQYGMETNFEMTVLSDGTYTDTPKTWVLVQDMAMLAEIYNKATTGVDLQYCLYISDTDAPPEDWDLTDDGLYCGWSTDAPQQRVGWYIWSRTATTLGEGTVKYGNYICLSTSLGKGVTEVVEQYSRSESKLTAPTSGWVDGIVERLDGYYIWARTKIIYIDGSVGYTEPYCDTSWEEIGAVAESANTALDIAHAALKREDFERVIRVDDDGLHVGDNITTCEVLVDSASVNVVMNGSKLSTFSDSFIRFGNMQIRKVAGGLAIAVYND